MKSLSTLFSSEKGLTLIEILVSLALLSIIIVYLLPLFTQSSKFNNLSKNITDATYVAESQMEEVYNWNKTLAAPSLASLTTVIKSNSFTADADSSCSNCYGKTKSGHYVLIQLKVVSDDLGKVIVKVYKDDKKNSQEAQMEMLLSWKK